MPDSGIEDRILVREAETAETAVIVLREHALNYLCTDQLKPGLERIVSDLTAKGCRRFVLNLEKVGVMDSCGLAAIGSLKKRVEGAGGRLVLSNLSPMIQRLMALTRLDRALDVYPSEEMAVRSG